MKYAIKYDSNSTVNGNDVGTVYARRCESLGRGVWSYSKDPLEGSLFTHHHEAAEHIPGKGWLNARVVRVDSTGEVAAIPPAEEQARG